MSIGNKIIKSAFKTLGLNISRNGKKSASPILYHNIELLFDVGANVGQYAMLSREEGYKGKIVSFEPLPVAYELLLKKSKNDYSWTVHERCAVGSNPSEAEINISENSYSSSLLPMLQAHALAAPESVYIGKAKTKIISLDSIFNCYRKNNEKTFLKIDTQGFESEVLKGLSENLKNIFAVQLELSIVPLYDNQETYQYFFTFFENNGFVLWSLIPGFTNSITGQMLQFDAIFVRRA